MGMDGEPGSGSSSIEHLLELQAGQVRRRDRVRLAASAAIIPIALASAVAISGYGAPGEPDAFASWLLLMITALLMLAAGGWWAARQLTPRTPAWPRTHQAARRGVIAAAVVASAAAVLLARTAPLAALTFGVIVAACLVLLDFREHNLDQRISRLEQQIAELVGYR